MLSEVEPTDADSGDEYPRVNLDDPPGKLHASVKVGGHPSVLASRGTIDEVAGIVHKDALLEIEGEERFAGLQKFFAAVHSLTSERRLSRIVYLVEKNA